MAAQTPVKSIPSSVLQEIEGISSILAEDPEGAFGTPVQQQVITPIGNAAGAAESAATAVPDFLSRLTSASLWIRVGEVVAGLILLGIGLNAMLKGKPLQVVTGAAGVAGKAAML